jgi:hypothetical protein
MGPLFGVYQLRLADAHLPANDLATSFKLVGIDPRVSPLDQGYSLIDNVAKAIWTAGDIVHQDVCRKSTSSRADADEAR